MKRRRSQRVQRRDSSSSNRIILDREIRSCPKSNRSRRQKKETKTIVGAENVAERRNVETHTNSASGTRKNRGGNSVQFDIISEDVENESDDVVLKFPTLDMMSIHLAENRFRREKGDDDFSPFLEKNWKTTKKLVALRNEASLRVAMYRSARDHNSIDATVGEATHLAKRKKRRDAAVGEASAPCSSSEAADTRTKLMLKE